MSINYWQLLLILFHLFYQDIVHVKNNTGVQFGQFWEKKIKNTTK